MTDENEIPFFLPFLKKEKVALDTYSFYFDRTQFDPKKSKRKATPDFSPGSMLEMKIPHKNQDERGDTRVFTVCSSPTEKDYYMFTTRIIESTFKKSLASLKKGDIVQFNGPWDDVEFDFDNKGQNVFLAGGIGITPFHSITKYMIDKKHDYKITLFSSWSSKEEMVFYDFFNQAQKALKHFRYYPTITHEQKGDDWKGMRGRIDQKVIERYIVNTHQATYYIVGPPGFVKGMKKVLAGMKIAQDKIIAEDFSGY